MNLTALFLSAVLDTPFMPFLGLPIYVFGFPRPKRFWQTLKYSLRSTSGEALLYKKFMENFVPVLQEEILQKYFFIFRAGKFYLLRIEKYLATLQVLERGNDFVVLALRGLEVQETTSCHSHEA